jgi:hypothetical protein
VSAIFLGGRRFEVQSDPIDVTSMSRPDPSWKVSDPAGHVHQWHSAMAGGPATSYHPADSYSLPTLIAITERAYWPDGDPYDAVIGYRCLSCGFVLDRADWPRRVADISRQFIHGVRCFLVDGVSVTASEFKRLALEAGAPAEAFKGWPE